MQITPEEFDLVVVGTGLQESFIASSAALIGKSVLHIDAEPDYGDLSRGGNLTEFVDCLKRRSGDTELPTVFRNVEFVKMEDSQLTDGGEYLIDLAPKLTYAAGPLLTALLKTQCHHSVDYRYLDACYILQDGKAIKVPSSRSDVFKDRTLEAVEKRNLTLWLKSAIEIFENGSYVELDFGAWLNSNQFTEKLKKMIQTSLCFSEQDQSSKEKFEALGLYLLSSGRFKDGAGPFITPYYTSSDVPQAFCRLCAIHGGVYVLNCGIKAILKDSDHSSVITVYDQPIRFEKLCVPAYLPLIRPELQTSGIQLKFKEKLISRGFLIVDKSIIQDSDQVFLVVPEGPVHILQIGAPSCPTGKYLIYCFCWSKGESARTELAPVVHKVLETCEGLTVLMECYWNQQFIQIDDHSMTQQQDLCLTDSPGGFVGYGSDLTAAKSKFDSLFPDHTFLKTVIKTREDSSDDEALFTDLESELSNQNKEEDHLLKSS